MNYIIVLVLLLVILMVVFIGHKKASTQSNKKLEQSFINDEKAMRNQLVNKKNQDHWLFKTHFPDAITFDKDAALNHELSQIQTARKLYNQSRNI